MEYPIHSVVMHITTGVCRIQDIQENNSPKTNIRNIMCCSRFLKKAQRYSFRLKMTLFGFDHC